MVSFPGGIISSTQYNPSLGGASGMWSLTTQMQSTRAGLWPNVSFSVGSINATSLFVGGGGGGGTNFGAGGGAGGLVYSTAQLFTGINYTVVIGAGGAGGTNSVGSGGSNGSNTTFTAAGGSININAIGGGGGGSANGVPAIGISGQNGGSGGGGGGGTSTVGVQGFAPYGQGNPGGIGVVSGTGFVYAGGGGGAGAVGGSATSTAGGAGGNGLSYNIANGTLLYYAGGGGAAGYAGAGGGQGGLGGGGSGNNTTSGSGSSGNTNLGGGGGGGASTAGYGNTGGSGVAIISYPMPQYFTGGVVTNINNSNVVHTFNTSGLLNALLTPIDTYQIYNTLLIHGDGNNGANNSVFIDSSSINNTMTRQGSTTQGSFSPFSTTSWSVYFPGTSTDYLTATVPAIGTSDFTVEFWFWPIAPVFSTANFPTLFELGPSQITGNLGVWWNGSNFTLRTGGASASGDIRYSTAGLTLNTWNYISINRVGGAYNVYYNGVAQTSTGNGGTIVNNLTGTALSIGYSTGIGGGSVYNGYISNFRYVVGNAVYSTNYSPTTTQLTVIANTALLSLQSNRNVGANTTVSNVAITVVGNATQVNTLSPFNPTTGYSNAVGGSILTGITSGDGLTTTSYSTSTGRFTGDFTVECWFYMNNVTGTQTIFTHRTTGFVPILVWVVSGTLTLYMSSAGASWDIINGQSLGTVNAGQWYHYALVRSGNSIKSYLNGVVVGAGATSSATLDSSTLPFRVGGTASTTEYFNGYISNVRMVNGTAVYTAPFTPPTAPLTAVTNTTLLLNANNASIIDHAQKVNLITYGTASVSTAQSKFGGGSMYFDTSNTAYIAAQTALFATGTSTGDFTAECWVYPTALYSSGVASPTLLSAWNVGGTTGWELCIATQGVYVRNNSSTIIATGGTVTTNQWYHIALVRYGTTISLYLNGTLVNSTTTGYTFTDTIFTIGAAYNNAATSNFNGYIDDVRFTKGYARYTSNFTPPTSAFLNT